MSPDKKASANSKNDFSPPLCSLSPTSSGLKPSPIKSERFSSPAISSEVNFANSSTEITSQKKLDNLHSNSLRKDKTSFHLSFTPNPNLERTTDRNIREASSPSNLDSSLSNFLKKELNIHVENLHALSAKHDRDRHQTQIQNNNNLSLEDLINQFHHEAPSTRNPLDDSNHSQNPIPSPLLSTASVTPMKSSNMQEDLLSPAAPRSEERFVYSHRANIRESKPSEMYGTPPNASRKESYSPPTSLPKISKIRENKYDTNNKQITAYEDVVSGLLTHKERMKLINAMRPVSLINSDECNSHNQHHATKKNTTDSLSLVSDPSNIKRNHRARCKDEMVVSYSEIEYLSTLLIKEEQLLLELNESKENHKSHLKQLQIHLSDLKEDLKHHNEEFLKKQEELQKVEEVMSLAVKANHGLLLDIHEKYGRGGLSNDTKDLSILNEIQNRVLKMQKKKQIDDPSANDKESLDDDAQIEEGFQFDDLEGMHQFQSHIAFQEQLRSVDSYLNIKTISDVAGGVN